MKAGRELDTLIAQKVMGWKPVTGCPAFFCAVDEQEADWAESVSIKAQFDAVEHYSTDITAALRVVRKMGRWKFSLTYERWEGNSWFTAIFDPVLTERRNKLMTKADTAPHAICLAALKALEET